MDSNTYSSGRWNPYKIHQFKPWNSEATHEDATDHLLGYQRHIPWERELDLGSKWGEDDR